MTAFAQRGLIAEWGISWLLPRLAGSAVALDLLFSSRKITGNEAAALGLVNAALPREEVLAHAQQYVRGLAATSSPASMAIMKRQVYQQLHAGMAAAENEARALMLESFSRPDFREGVQSFVQRRAPAFQRIPRPGRTWSEGLEPGVQEAEFVAFWVGQHVPAVGAGLADVGGPGAESEQPLQLGVLVAVGGVDVDVQSELPGPRVAAGADDEGGLRAAEADVGRPDLDASVVFPAEFDVAEDLAPECGEPVGVGGSDDQLTDAACHARQCT